MSRSVIGVFMAGINKQYQADLCAGMQKRAREYGYQLMFYNCIGQMENNELANAYIGEDNIFTLPELGRLSGAVVLPSTFISPDESPFIKKLSGYIGRLPIVSIDYPMKGAINLSFDDGISIRELVRHFYYEHNARTFSFISGPENNEVANERLNAFIDEATSLGVFTDKRRVYYGNFVKEGGANAASLMLTSHLPLPDAVICANDDMAIGFHEELTRRGGEAASSILFSGFDCTEEAKAHMPMLTSVRRPVYDAGALAVAMINNALHLVAQETDITLETKLELGESCGCRVDRRNTQESLSSMFLRKNLLNKDFMQASFLSVYLAGISSFTTFRKRFAEFVDKWSFKELYICVINENFLPDEQRVQAGDTAVPRTLYENGYPNDMRMIYGFCEGRTLPERVFPRALQVPRPNNEYPLPLVFMPLHYQKKNFGYIAFDLEHATDFIVYTLVSNLGAAMENMRLQQIVQSYVSALERMYLQDPLTGLDNRRGLMKRGTVLFERARDMRFHLMVISMDMDRLKTINDTWGHSEGDKAICAMGACLARAIYSGDICAHVSGDEFILLAVVDKPSDSEAYIAQIERAIKDYNDKSGKPYIISASFGAYCVVPGNETYEEIINCADKLMYEIKEKKHRSLKTLLRNSAE